MNRARGRAADPQVENGLSVPAPNATTLVACPKTRRSVTTSYFPAAVRHTASRAKVLHRAGRKRESRLDAIAELQATQCQVVRRAQLRALGWTRKQIQHEVTFGRWHQAAPEVIALQNSRLTGDQLLWLGILHAGPGSALSHGTTLKLNGLEHWEPDAVDVLSPKGHTVERLDGFFFHESRRDYRAWIHPIRLPPQLRVEEACLLAAERKRSVRAGIGW